MGRVADGRQLLAFGCGGCTQRGACRETTCSEGLGGEDGDRTRIIGSKAGFRETRFPVVALLASSLAGRDTVHPQPVLHDTPLATPEASSGSISPNAPFGGLFSRFQMLFRFELPRHVRGQVNSDSWSSRAESNQPAFRLSDGRSANELREDMAGPDGVEPSASTSARSRSSS